MLDNQNKDIYKDALYSDPDTWLAVYKCEWKIKTSASAVKMLITHHNFYPDRAPG